MSTRRDDLRSTAHVTQEIVDNRLRRLNIKVSNTAPSNGLGDNTVTATEEGDAEFDWHYITATIAASTGVDIALATVADAEFVNGYLGITHGNNRYNSIFSITRDAVDAYIAEQFSNTPTAPDVTVVTLIFGGEIKLRLTNNEASSVSVKIRYNFM